MARKFQQPNSLVDFHTALDLLERGDARAEGRGLAWILPRHVFQPLLEDGRARASLEPPEDWQSSIKKSWQRRTECIQDHTRERDGAFEEHNQPARFFFGLELI